MYEKILIVEDDTIYRGLLVETLYKEFVTVAVSTAEEALSHLSQTSFDMVLVDVGLPGMDGLRFGTAVREISPSVPIIFLSGQTNVEDRLAGFSIGAADYIVKPVDRRELMARIKARLPMTATVTNPVAPETVGAGPITIHLPSQRATYSWQGRRFEMELTATEFRLLSYFLAHVDRVLSRQELMDKVWTESRPVEVRNVDVTISKVREKLGPYGNLLKTIRSQGYRLETGGIRE